MEKLPEEMLRAVFVYLSGSDRLPVSLTCRRWFNLLKDSVPSINAIHISLDTSACSTRFLEASLSEAAFSICLCPGHAQKHAVLLQQLFQTAGKKLASLAIEDNLIPRAKINFMIKFQEGIETQISDMTVHVLLNNMPKCLRSLHFQGVDFSKVRPWTFALLVKLKSLEELYILDAVLPIDNESLFARMISPSFDTLTSISVTNNEQITDKFVSTLARRCPVLQTVNLNGCKRITTLSVLAFAENASHRITELTFIHVQATMFNPNLVSLGRCTVSRVEVMKNKREIDFWFELFPTFFSLNYSIRFNCFTKYFFLNLLAPIQLQRYLSSPLLAGGNYWRANVLKLEIGFQHNAICLENICLTNLFIIVFI
ncbi:unnamed protein product [Onchocerca flexuosa]|uniref:F-box domain-containing protein n=1 Tax=Onchocerca flexuosa TaxID=387005 RepID=A0A183I226_9BILA|nr:unnamed protein product [Onchocerca flexuosa]